ncbi:hypothetical protein EC991_003854 [Linnemannia zychae]|nr:hypothetical protein EC991_003854 [Linnemannia zychae]
MSLYHAQPNIPLLPSPTTQLPALNRVLEAIDAKNEITQLSVLSDDQLVKDTQLHVALLCQPNTLIRLLELEDVYVQFSACRLVKAILLNRSRVFAITTLTSSTDNTPQPVLLHNNRQRVIRAMVQKLITVDQSCSGTGRAILELFHGLLKDHRHLVRNLDNQGYDVDSDGEGNSSGSEAATKIKTQEMAFQHVASTLVQELKTCPEFWEATVLEKIFSLREMQYPALVLMIDLEKARVFHAVELSDEFRQSVIFCHENIVCCMDKWMAGDRIGLLPLKKHLELICISMKSSSSSHDQLESRQQQDQNERDTSRPFRVLMALSPLLLDTLKAFQEHDPDLQDFSAGRTTFILPDDSNAALSKNPEAVRQLGQICLTAALSILDSIELPNNHEHGDRDYRRADTDYREKVIESTKKYLVPFLEEWLGDSTLLLLLIVYGEDDAGVSWLLRTMSRIYRRVLYLQSASSSLRHPPNTARSPLSLPPAMPPISSNSAGVLLDKVQRLLETYFHPLEALFRFLETVGFDYQTVLDLLLTLDDHESGGMLAAVMVILRSFTEDTHDQNRIIERWRQEIQEQAQQQEQEQELEEEQEQEQEQEQQRLEMLSNVNDCLNQLSHQIQRLYKNNLFPYNPTPLLLVLERTQDVLSTVLGQFI